MLALLGGLALPLGAYSSTQDFMITRPIPSSNEQLPLVGLGTWQQFDVGPGASEQDPLAAVLREMIAKGGRLIDTSPMYGRAEKVIGDLTKEPAITDKLFYATKVWTSGRDEGIRQMNASMEKMQRKVMDLIEVHNLQDYQTHLKTLNEWKVAGKIKYTGLTHYTSSAHERLATILEKERVDFVQFNYSIRERNAEHRLLNTAKEKGVAVIINEPFEKGTLFSLVKGKSLPAWAADYNINSWAQFFLKFILAHPAVNCVIPGTSNPAHVADNMQAGFGPLPDEPTRKKMITLIESL